MNTKPNILARIQPSPHTLLKQIDGKGVMMVNFGRGEVKTIDKYLADKAIRKLLKLEL